MRLSAKFKSNRDIFEWKSLSKSEREFASHAAPKGCGREREGERERFRQGENEKQRMEGRMTERDREREAQRDP